MVIDRLLQPGSVSTRMGTRTGSGRRARKIAAGRGNCARGAMPEVPTVAESGFPGFNVSEWAAIVGPAKLPEHVVEKLHAAFFSALNSPDISRKLREQASYEVIASTPEELRAFLAAEIRRIREIAERAKIRADG